MAIKETKNITKAAELLNIAQPSLSRYLRDKEDEIGHRLFKRKNSRIIGLTEFGELYFKYAEKMNDLNEEYQKNKRSFETNDKEVRILIPIVISLDLVNFIVNIRKNNPQIDFKIASDSMAQIQEKIKGNDFDYAVVHSKEKQENKKCVYQTNTTLVIPERIQKKYEKEIYLDELGRKHIDIRVLKDEKFYIPKKSRLIGQIARYIFEEYNFTPKDVVEWDSSDLCLMMADKENAVCFYTFNREYNLVHVFLDKEFVNYFYLEKINKKAIDFKA